VPVSVEAADAPVEEGKWLNWSIGCEGVWKKQKVMTCFDQPIQGVVRPRPRPRLWLGRARNKEREVGESSLAMPYKLPATPSNGNRSETSFCSSGPLHDRYYQYSRIRYTIGIINTAGSITR